MEKEIFIDHFKKGLGDIILFLKSNTNNQEYADIIYHFAVHNHDYDRQSEESRAQYIWDAISYCLQTVHKKHMDHRKTANPLDVINIKYIL